MYKRQVSIWVEGGHPERINPLRLPRTCLTLLVSLLVVHTHIASGQSAFPTNGILQRTLMVQSQYSKASIFSIDVDNREYWITAKHVLNNREYPHYGSVTNKSVSLLLLNPTAPGEQWVPVNFSVVDPGEDVDVVVLAAERPVLENPVPTVSPDASAMLGGDCEFLGFPYGAGWRATYDNCLLYTSRCV